MVLDGNGNFVSGIRSFDVDFEVRPSIVVRASDASSPAHTLVGVTGAAVPAPPTTVTLPWTDVDADRIFETGGERAVRDVRRRVHHAHGRVQRRLHRDGHGKLDAAPLSGSRRFTPILRNRHPHAARSRREACAMRPVLLLLLAALVPTAASSVLGPNALYVDAAGDAHEARFTYEGPCEGLGSTTLVLLDTGETFGADVWSTTVGDVCGAGLSCLDCPPVPKAYAWELTGLRVALVGGGPEWYDHYADQALAYSLSGDYVGGHLTAWGVVSWAEP